MYKTFTRSQRNFTVLKKKTKGHTVCVIPYITLLKCKIRRMENQWLYRQDGCKEMVHIDTKEIEWIFVVLENSSVSSRIIIYKSTQVTE